MYQKITLSILTCLQICAVAQVNTDSTLQTKQDSIVPLSADTAMPPVKDKTTSGRGEVYKLKAATDIPVTAIGTGWSLYAFTKIYSKDSSTEEKILSLDKNDIPKFDRHGASVYHPEADKIGNILFYGAMPLPVVLMFDKNIRKDALKVATLYLESMSVTGLLYTGSVYLFDRYRPYAYNPNVPMSERTRGGAKNSFFAGHVALVGTSTFFIAKVLNDYYPGSKRKWIPFTLASIATGTTAVMRYRGGQHFLSDLLLGTTIGVLSGILVPHVHKNREQLVDRLSFTTSYMGGTPQFGIVYKFTKQTARYRPAPGGM